jgi:peroxiredoxin
MALTQSTMIDLGSPAPDFALPSTEGDTVTLDHFKDAQALVVLFICNHCPYVIHIAPALSELAKEYMEKGVAFVAINSNDTEAYPADSFDKMKTEKAQRDYRFPYLFDESQAVAQAYSAACTPDIYVFDKDRRLAYRGQFDDTRPHRISSGNYDSEDNPATGADLRKALDTLLAGDKIPEHQYPSMGCNIKWKPGNEPT